MIAAFFWGGEIKHEWPKKLASSYSNLNKDKDEWTATKIKLKLLIVINLKEIYIKINFRVKMVPAKM